LINGSLTISLAFVDQSWLTLKGANGWHITTVQAPALKLEALACPSTAKTAAATSTTAYNTLISQLLLSSPATHSLLPSSAASLAPSHTVASGTGCLLKLSVISHSASSAAYVLNPLKPLLTTSACKTAGQQENSSNRAAA
jgi:hypothetical protein